MSFRALSVSLVLAVVAAACTGNGLDTTTTTAPATSAVPATAAPLTVATATSSAASTQAQIQTVTVEGDLPEQLAASVAVVYNRLQNGAADTGDLPESLVAYLDAASTTYTPTHTASLISAELPTGESVGVVRVGSDVLFAADEGDSWSIIGVALAGHTPWLMQEPGLLLILGSDARPGQLQPRFRADSIHLLALSPTLGAGTIVGFPRDTYITAEQIAAANAFVGIPEDDLPAGAIKWTNLMSGRGPEIMLETAREITGLEVEGYIVTGFVGFDALISELGGLQITLPTDLSTGNNWENFPAGSQLLDPTRALQLAQIRKAVPRGDFGRSLNQGLIMLAAMAMVQVRGIDGLPDLVKILAENTFTDLSAGALLSYSATALLMDPAGLENIVLPGDVETINNRSVVLLHEDEKQRVLADIADDGILEP